MSTVRIHDKDFEQFLSEAKIQERVTQLAVMINTDYFDKQPVFIGVLNGAFFFMADLLKHVNIDCELSFMKVSSYSGK